MPPKKTLLIIAHGSKSAAWNHAIERFCANLKTHHGQNHDFDDVKWCFLEHEQPTIQAALESHCAIENNDLIALPLFLTIGQHVGGDIPDEMNKVAKLLDRKPGITYYRCKACNIQLLDPPPTVDLLAANIVHRIEKLNVPTEGNGIMIVYYGSKKYLIQWNHLAFNIQSKLTETYPKSVINWTYGGDAVDFSTDSLTIELQKMSLCCDKILIMPALVAVGVVQNEIIPAAVKESQLEDRIIYPGDAILPDGNLEKQVLSYIHTCLTKQ